MSHLAQIGLQRFPHRTSEKKELPVGNEDDDIRLFAVANSGTARLECDFVGVEAERIVATLAVSRQEGPSRRRLALNGALCRPTPDL